jgi:hypothetical protein
LQETLKQQEKDALEVISALHKGNENKDLQIQALNVNIEEIKLKCDKDKEAVMKEYESKMQDVSIILNEKESAFKVMQQEFLTIKDFRVII